MMAGSSKNELIAWLSTAPRTMGWGAIMAFNRTDTNTVLLQEYIERFSTDTYLPPVEGYIGDSDTVGQFITDYVMDYPRLSFEIADVARDSPDAKLAMKVVGGTHVTFKDVPSGREATRVEVVDPLNGPELTLDLQLVDVPGTVSAAGKVVLDLKRSSNFSLSYSDFLREQRLGGLFFQQLFEALPDNKRTIVISEITKVADNPIKPGSFKLRTQAAPGAKVRSAANYGDGAVLVLVAMEGEPSGGNPDNSFKYLIPNDTDKAYGATLLIGNKLIIETVVPDRFEKSGIVGRGQWASTRNDNGFYVIVPTEGMERANPPSLIFNPGESPSFYQYLPALHLGNHAEFYSLSEGSVADNAIQMRVFNRPLNNSTLTIEGHGYCKINVKWDARSGCKYRVNHDSGLIEPVGWVTEPFELGATPYADDPGDPNILAAWLLGPIAQSARHFREFLGRVLQKLLSDLPSINVFTLQSILFKNNNSVVLDDVALPGDMAIFGWVAPSLTHFKLDPLQPLLGIGETLQFNTVPAAPSGVVWTVHNILGSNENPGTISGTGLYTAPASIKGAFLRVRVKATAGSYSSSALVSVVVNDITVSPVVQTCDGGHSRTLSAGTRGGGTLSWALKNPGNGGRLEPAENGKYKYSAPTAVGGKDFFVEEIVVRNELTGKTKSAWIMVVLVNLPISIVRDTSVSLPANQIKLQAKIGGSIIPDEEVRWEVLAGVGSIVNGIYTAPATFTERFVLLGATDEPRPGMIFTGVTLLPLPLFDYPKTRASGLAFMDV